MSRPKITISAPGPVLPGSVTTAVARCGKDNCACKAKHPKLHGPYFRWTGIINGKRTTKTISAEVAAECRKRIDNYRRLTDKLHSVIEHALENAPWKDNET